MKKYRIIKMDNKYYPQRLTVNEYGKNRYKTIDVVGCATQEEAYQICVSYHDNCRCEDVFIELDRIIHRLGEFEDAQEQGLIPGSI